MNAMLVGADKLGNIPVTLSACGIRINRHVSGRDPAHHRRVANLPSGTDLLIVFTDFISHDVMRNFRVVAESEGVQIIYCRRSIYSLKESLRQNGIH